jgi:hypothetical protein
VEEEGEKVEKKKRREEKGKEKKREGIVGREDQQSQSQC